MPRAHVAMHAHPEISPKLPLEFDLVFPDLLLRSEGAFYRSFGQAFQTNVHIEIMLNSIHECWDSICKTSLVECGAQFQQVDQCMFCQFVQT